MNLLYCNKNDLSSPCLKDNKFQDRFNYIEGKKEQKYREKKYKIMDRFR